MKEVVGANKSEVAVMGSLSSNIHFLMVPFYRPTPIRFKIMIEHGAFPSDWVFFSFFSEILFLVYIVDFFTFSPSLG